MKEIFKYFPVTSYKFIFFFCLFFNLFIIYILIKFLILNLKIFIYDYEYIFTTKINNILQIKQKNKRNII